MLADERKTKIMEMLEKRHSVTTSELVELFRVSVETIRRDLEYLESQGTLKRVHGGAIAAHRLQSYTSMPGRVSQHQPEKRHLAWTACSYIQEGDFIALDAGTTMLELAELIGRRFRNLTVLTHSLEIVRILSEKGSIRTILAGGLYLPQEGCFGGHLTLDMIRQLHVSKCFIAPSAVSLDFGISDHIQELIMVQRELLDIADQAFILADSSKFESCAPLRICALSPRHIYITDGGLSDEILKAYGEAAVNVVRTGAPAPGNGEA